MAGQEGVVRRRDSFPERLGARGWFLVRIVVGVLVGTVLSAFVPGLVESGFGFVVAIALGVGIAALIQLAARRAGMRPPALDLRRRAPDIRIPEQGSSPLPPPRFTPAARAAKQARDTPHDGR